MADRGSRTGVAWPATQIAWGMCCATLGLLGGQTFLVLASGTPLRTAENGLNSFPVITVGTLLGAVLGAAVATRQPRNRVGWLFLAGQLGTAAGLLAEAYANAVGVYDFPGPRSLLEPAVVLSYNLGAVWALTFVSAVLLVVPDGTLPSRRWRVLALSLGVPFVVDTLVLVTYAARHTLHVNQSEAGIAWYYVVPLAASWVLLALNLATAALSLILRLRRATGVLRQQLRWLATASVGLAVGTVVAIVAPTTSGGAYWLFDLPLYVAYVSVPMAAGFAVLRYRLYDIDIVISRTVLLTLLVGFVTGGYVAVVVLLGDLVGEGISTSFGVSLLITVAVALSFQPLRLRAVRFADHLAYGRRAAPYEALARLGRSLGESPDADSLLAAIAGAAGNAVGAQRVTVSLDGEGGSLTATWPATLVPASRSATPARVEVCYQDERLGEIDVRLPPGRRLSDRERRVLNDIADQAAIALRNVQLSAELVRRVRELEGQTAQLHRSRLRLFTAGDAERRRLERSIAGSVLPRLGPLPNTLAGLAASSAATSPVAIGETLSDTQAALEALRAITQGVHPSQLVRHGLGPALTSYLARTGRPGQVVIDPSAAGRRFEPRVEAVAYFCVTEAIEADEDAGSAALVELREAAGRLGIRISPGGRGRLSVSQQISDRVDIAGGAVRVVVGHGGESALDVQLPLAKVPQRDGATEPGPAAPVPTPT